MLESGTEQSGHYNLKSLLRIVQALLDPDCEFYNAKYHNNSLDLLECLRENNFEMFGLSLKDLRLKEDCWQRQIYSKSIYYLNTLEHFA